MKQHRVLLVLTFTTEKYGEVEVRRHVRENFTLEEMRAMAEKLLLTHRTKKSIPLKKLRRAKLVNDHPQVII